MTAMWVKWQKIVLAMLAMKLIWPLWIVIRIGCYNYLFNVLVLFKMPVRIQSLTYNVCNHHSVYTMLIIIIKIFRQKDYISKIMMQVFNNQCSVAMHISTLYIQIPIYTYQHTYIVQQLWSKLFGDEQNIEHNR